jgi:hypothetical protein
VNAVVCSKKKKSDKNAEKKQKKDLTGPTLLEISEYHYSDELRRPVSREMR